MKRKGNVRWLRGTRVEKLRRLAAWQIGQIDVLAEFEMCGPRQAGVIFVLDTSIPACWALEDEQDPRVDAAFARIRTEEAVVPSLWWFELLNTLIVNERRKRITESDTGVFVRALADLRVRVNSEPEEGVVLSLARAHGLSVYDASYLELAVRHAIPLATLDAQLTAAARSEGSGLIRLRINLEVDREFGPEAAAFSTVLASRAFGTRHAKGAKECWSVVGFSRSF